MACAFDCATLIGVVDGSRASPSRVRFCCGKGEENPPDWMYFSSTSRTKVGIVPSGSATRNSNSSECFFLFRYSVRRRLSFWGGCGISGIVRDLSGCGRLFRALGLG